MEEHRTYTHGKSANDKRLIGHWSNENGMFFFFEIILLVLVRGCWRCSLQLRNQAETEQHSNNTKQNGYAWFMNGKTKRFIWTWVASNHENDFWLLIMSRVFSQQSTVATCRSIFFFSYSCIDMYYVEWQIKYRAASCQLSSNSSLSQCVTPIV